MNVRIVADKWKSQFLSFCQYIEITGDLRREKETDKIDLIALPIFHKDLFDGASDNLIDEHDKLSEAVASEMAKGNLVWRSKNGPVLDRSSTEQAIALKYGRRYIPITDKRSMKNIDLFIVRPPSNFFWQLMVVTGPKEFIKKMIIRAYYFGYEVREGAIWSKKEGALFVDEPIDFTSEKEIFDLLKEEYVNPKYR
jgi:DNA polymerase/3'-5' exonuclease PolX